jgi:hypothetical protein
MTDPYTHDLGRPHTDPGPSRARRPRPLVFVAAVYEGNPMEFLNGLAKAAESLRAAAGVVTALPDFRLLPDHGDERVEWERDLIEHCDALVVIGGRDVPDRDDAEGVERWVDAATGFGLPVFDGPGPLIEWVRNR